LEVSMKSYILEVAGGALVSTAMNSIIMLVAIAEIRSTANEVRETIARFESSISNYASAKTEALDEVVPEEYGTAKESVKGFLDKFGKEPGE